MRLRFLGKDSKPNESPTLYATDQDSYVIQGWIVTDPAVLDRLHVPDDETIVEIPARLMIHLIKDGIEGEVSNLIPPIVYVLPNGNYIVGGRRVSDQETLSQMDIPDHETCVEVPKSDIMALLVGG
jgi:hypothetical protein